MKPRGTYTKWELASTSRKESRRRAKARRAKGRQQDRQIVATEKSETGGTP